MSGILQNLNNFQQRVVVSLLSAVLLFSIIFTSHQSIFNFVFSSTVCLIQWVALKEFYSIICHKGARPLRWPGYIFSILIVQTALICQEQQEGFLMLSLCSLLLMISCVMRFKKVTNSICDVATTLFGVLYIAIPSALFVRINFLPAEMGLGDGRLWIFYLLAVTKITDMFGYIVGKRFGKNKLAMRLSPKKTWEGAIGGLLAAIATSLSFSYFPALWPSTSSILSISDSLILGCIIGIISQLGDLAESLMKRDAQVKDSNQIPGVGGVLDMIDSLLFTIPCLYVYLYRS